MNVVPSKPTYTKLKNKIKLIFARKYFLERQTETFIIKERLTGVTGDGVEFEFGFSIRVILWHLHMSDLNHELSRSRPKNFALYRFKTSERALG